MATGIKTLRKNRVKVIHGDIDVSLVMRQGLVVMLSMGRWRAEQKLLAEDLALNASEMLSDYIRLGKKTLIKPELQKKMNSIESLSRNAIRKYSYDTPFGYFVPAGAYPVLDDVMKEYEAKWMAMGEALATEMKKNEVEIREAYRTFAMSLYKRLRKKGSARRYAKEYVERVVGDIPTPEKVRNSFYFSFQSGEVPVPKVMSKYVRQELLNEESAKLKLDAVREAAQAKVETAVKREEAVQKMHARRMARYEARKEKDVDRFLDAVGSQIRSMILDTTKAALSSISRNEGLCGRTSGALSKLVKDFRMMNILDDDSLESEIDKLEGLMKETSTRTNEQKVKEALTDLQFAARGTVMEISAPRRKVRGDIIGDAMIDDKPEKGSARQVRANVI